MKLLDYQNCLGHAHGGGLCWTLASVDKQWSSVCHQSQPWLAPLKPTG